MLAVMTCGFLDTPLNGSQNGSSPLVGSTITFICDDGYRLEGSVLRQCTDAGTWDGVEVKCVRDSLTFTKHGKSSSK